MLNRNEIERFATKSEGNYTDKIILFCDYTRTDERYEKFLKVYCPELGGVFNLAVKETFENFMSQRDKNSINFYTIREFCLGLLEETEIEEE